MEDLAGTDDIDKIITSYLEVQNKIVEFNKLIN